MTDQNGGLYLDLDVPFNRIVSGDEFDLDEYEEVSKFIDEKYPTLSYWKRLEMMDELLFKKKE